MYWKNITALKELLIQGQLPQKMQMWYLFATIGIYEIFLELASYYPSESSIVYLDYLGSVVSVSIILFGIIYAYSANGKDAGSYFMQRYISINFVINFRYGVLIFLPVVFLFTVVSLVAQSLYGIEFNDYYIEIIFFIATITLELLIVLFTAKHIKDVANRYKKE